MSKATQQLIEDATKRMDRHLSKLMDIEAMLCQMNAERLRVNQEIDTLCLEGMRLSGNASVIAKFQQISLLVKLPLGEGSEKSSDEGLKPV